MAASLRHDPSFEAKELLYRIVATLLEYTYSKQVTQTIQGPIAGPVRFKEWSGLVVRRGRPPNIDPADAEEMIVEREAPLDAAAAIPGAAEVQPQQQ